MNITHGKIHGLWLMSFLEENSNPSFFSISWLSCVAWGISVPQPGIKPAPPAVEARYLNHWTAREVPFFFFFYFSKPLLY